MRSHATAGGVAMIVDTSGLDAKLQAFARTARNMERFWSRVGEILRRSIMQNFRDQGRPQKWQRLSEATLERKAVNKTRILVDSGRLRNSINWKADDDGVTVGTSGVEYAAIHQWGGDAGRKSSRVFIPARPYVMIQPEDMETIAEDFEDFLTAPLRGSR